MEIISRVAVYPLEARKPEEKRICRKLIEKFAGYIEEESKSCVLLYISNEFPEARELIHMVRTIRESYEDSENWVNEWEPLRKYVSKDYKEAVAYQIIWGNFVQGYGDYDLEGNYWTSCCGNDQWYDGGSCGIQIGNYRMPKGHMRNKKCAITYMYDYVVNEEIKYLMKAQGALEEDFFPVLTKNDETVCWQLRPKNILNGLGQENNWTKMNGCLNCGKPTYIVDEYRKFCMADDTYKQMRAVNRTEEEFGRMFQPKIIINRDVYRTLKKACARLCFEPIFLNRN